MRDDREQQLITDLARLRREPPFSVDVAARVVAEVRRMGPPPRATVASRRVAAWSAAAALLAAFALAALLIPGVPAGADVAARAGGMAGAVLAWLAALPRATARGIAWSADVLASFGPLAAALAPATAAALATALLGMVGITTFVVGRDLRRGRAEAR